jgi:hypothetical protein
MKTLFIFTVLSLLLISLSSAESSNLAYFTLTSGIVFINSTYGIYPNYTLAVPEYNKPLRITNPAIVYMITPVDSSRHPAYETNYNCNFLGAEGAVTHMGPEQDVVPQAQVSVTCFGTGTSPASGNATSTTISATVFLSSGPPYSTATGSSSSTVGGAAASASAGSGTRSATAGMGSGTVIPFTGDAVKAAGSAGLAFFAFVLGIMAAMS